MPTQSKKGKDRQRTRRVEEEPDEEMVDGGDEQEAHDSDAEAGGDGGGWTLEPTAHIEVSNHAKKAAKDLGQASLSSVEAAKFVLTHCVFG